MGSRKRPYRRNIEKLRRTQGCLTDSIAYYLNIHPERVPFFVCPRKGWNDRVKAFFRRHGYKVWWVKASALPKLGMHIVCGKSMTWKTYAHVVVYRSGKMAYDPDYPSRWTDRRMTHRLVVHRLPRKKATGNADGSWPKTGEMCVHKTIEEHRLEHETQHHP